MKKRYRLGFTIGLILLVTILLISVYTVILQNSYSQNTEESTLERNTQCADAIDRIVSDKFTKEDFETITSVDDMKLKRYQELQQELNELRTLNSTRYLYTAGRNAEGKLVYLVDGLDLDAEDFAYPGTYIEEEMISYIEAALSGETIYSKKIVNTTWGHIFTACYPVMESENSDEMIGALCMEMDVEDAYVFLRKSARTTFRTACLAGIVSALLAMERPDAKTIPILAMTANAFAEGAQKCLDAGMNAHLAKPLEIDKGIAAIARFCRANKI